LASETETEKGTERREEELGEELSVDKSQQFQDLLPFVVALAKILR
jgi:hypothetical protein